MSSVKEIQCFIGISRKLTAFAWTMKILQSYMNRGTYLLDFYILYKTSENICLQTFSMSYPYRITDGNWSEFSCRCLGLRASGGESYHKILSRNQESNDNQKNNWFWLVNHLLYHFWIGKFGLQSEMSKTTTEDSFLVNFQ